MAITMDKVRATLEEERELLLQGLEREPELGDRTADVADVATTRIEQLTDDRERQRRQERIAQIDAALERMEQGTWGTCVGCGGSIPKARLQALPTATTCVACASR